MICNAVSQEKLLVAQYEQPSKNVKSQSWAIPNKYVKQIEIRDRTTSKFIEKH